MKFSEILVWFVFIGMFGFGLSNIFVDINTNSQPVTGIANPNTTFFNDLQSNQAELKGIANQAQNISYAGVNNFDTDTGGLDIVSTAWKMMRLFFTSVNFLDDFLNLLGLYIPGIDGYIGGFLTIVMILLSVTAIKIFFFGGENL